LNLEQNIFHSSTLRCTDRTLQPYCFQPALTLLGGIFAKCQKPKIGNIPIGTFPPHQVNVGGADSAEKKLRWVPSPRLSIHQNFSTIKNPSDWVPCPPILNISKILAKIFTLVFFKCFVLLREGG
jgi:hypothetical protein